MKYRTDEDFKNDMAQFSGLTVIEMCKKMGISPSTYYRYLKRITEPESKDISEIPESEDISEILESDTGSKSISEDRRQIEKLIKKLGKDERDLSDAINHLIAAAEALYFTELCDSIHWNE